MLRIRERRSVRRPATWKLLSTVLFVWCASSSYVLSGAPLTIHDEPFDVFKVAEVATKAWPSKSAPGRLTFTHVPTRGGDAVIQLYDSRHDDNVIVADNCVASPQERVIDCDLAMIDGLIEELRLVSIYGGDNRPNALPEFRETLLSWVLAHEMGHIALMHGISDFDDPIRGFEIFSVERQRDELAADRFALHLAAGPNAPRTTLEQSIIDVSNALIRKALCPRSFPDVCDRIPVGVGVIYDYRASASPIVVPIGHSHPALLARFLRILFLEARLRHDVGYEASKVIELLRVEDDGHRGLHLRTLGGVQDGRLSGPTSR